jgi:phosphate transport system permease protein
MFLTRSFREKIPPFLLGSTTLLTVLLLFGIFIFLVWTAIGAFQHIELNEFFLSGNWNPNAYGQPTWGILSLLLGTLMICTLSMFIAIPTSLAISIYLSEIARPRVREFLKPAIEMIASIPSVVLGLLGILIVAPLIAWSTNQVNGLNALSASILVAIAVIPTIASMSEDALSGVRRSIKEASLALGATQWMTIRNVIVPAAKSGIFAGIMLGLGRAIGETVIVLMVAGNSRAIPSGFLSAVSPLTATIAIDIKEVIVGDLHWQSLFVLGSILFILTFVLNLVAELLMQSEETA